MKNNYQGNIESGKSGLSRIFVSFKIAIEDRSFYLRVSIDTRR